MTFVEDDATLLAPAYARPLRYVYDEKVPGPSKFRYVFNEGGLTCSEAAGKGDQRCIVSAEEMTAIGPDRPSFVYADNGCWSDNADGKGARRRDFVLVCGPHVYSCEAQNSSATPQSKIQSVQQFFTALAAAGCAFRVVSYVRAKDTAPGTAQDPNLYLFLGDLHMPPVSWFFTSDAAGQCQAYGLPPPLWIIQSPAFQRRAIMINKYYNITSWARQNNSMPAANAGIGLGNPDIFGKAGPDLVRFLDALSNLPAAIKARFHFIQTGDMFELWLGRDYLYAPGPFEPSWKSPNSPNGAADWILEVMIQNLPVIEAFHRLDGAGLKEVKYLWGNHDAYTKAPEVCAQVAMPRRDPTYSGLNGDLFGEHGHRFDRSNHDNTSAWLGPLGASWAYKMPVVRQGEPIIRDISGIGHPEEVDCYLLGATLIYLYERYDRHQPPFAIYVMGHTHARKLYRFNIKADWHLYEASG
jgi:hypothetical protein